MRPFVLSVWALIVLLNVRPFVLSVWALTVLSGVRPFIHCCSYPATVHLTDGAMRRRPGTVRVPPDTGPELQRAALPVSKSVVYMSPQGQSHSPACKSVVYMSPQGQSHSPACKSVVYMSRRDRATALPVSKSVVYMSPQGQSHSPACK